MKNIDNTNVGEGLKSQAFIICWHGCKLVQPVWESVWNIFVKLNIDLPDDLVSR